MRKILVVALALVLVSVVIYASKSHAVPQTQTVTFEATTEATPKPVITCAGVTKKGERCKRRVKKQGDYCWMHASQKPKQ